MEGNDLEGLARTAWDESEKYMKHIEDQKVLFFKLPRTETVMKLVKDWLKVNKQRVADFCNRSVEDITIACLTEPPQPFKYRERAEETFVEGPYPTSTLVIIAVSELNRNHGMFGYGDPLKYPDLKPAEGVVISGKDRQHFPNSRGGGVGIILRLKNGDS